MYCENCGKNYANVKYTQIINGKKKQMYLCEECSKILGIANLNIPIDFSTFLQNFLESFEDENILPELLNTKELKCKRCNSTFEDFINTGRFGCHECYETFEEKIDPLLRSIQGSNRHIGRIGKIGKIDNQNSSQKTDSYNEADLSKSTEIEELNKKLKMAIKEERYEDAAILRDKIKEIEGEN